jgi:Reverse transcriptase (RNA-dependent DNA polymerase).
MLLCRQVSDMLIAGGDAKVVKEFAMDISTKLKVTWSDKPSVHFNGLDIIQTRQGIQINCSTYIEKLLEAHGWNEVSNKPLEPISPSKVKELEPLALWLILLMVNYYKRKMVSIIMVLLGRSFMHILSQDLIMVLQ